MDSKLLVNFLINEKKRKEEEHLGEANSRSERSEGIFGSIRGDTRMALNQTSSTFYKDDMKVSLNLNSGHITGMNIFTPPNHLNLAPLGTFSPSATPSIHSYLAPPITPNSKEHELKNKIRMKMKERDQ